ncbi:putative transmembrane protein [Bdellovibrio bacteriovorus W]|nr:putative transmembrane protein [Bdellovibrio bacteriovorus W]
MAFFEKNEGNLDRTVRIVIGLVLISLAFIGPKNPWFLLGFLPLITGLLGRCPAYKIFGVNTCPRKR